MTVLDLPVPAGAVVTTPVPDLRGAVTPASFLASSLAETSPSAQSDDASSVADELGTTRRGLETARDMLLQHLAVAGEGRAGPLTAKVSGPRRFELRSAGVLAAAREPGQGVGVALVADPLVLLAVGGRERALHWRLLPGGPSVTARADALRLLRAIASGGHLLFRLGTQEMPPLDLDGGPWDSEDEWRLFEDLAAIEEWSGATIPVPAHVSAEEATRVAQAASWARTQQVEAKITGALEFTPTDGPAVTADELRIHQDFGVNLFGVEVPLGEGIARIALDRVEPAAGATLGRFRAWPTTDAITFSLTPPATRRRPALRTQTERQPAPDAAGTGLSTGSLPVARRASAQLRHVLATRPDRQKVSTAASSSALLDELRGH